MFATILSAAQQAFLERVITLPPVATFYLAGGTALALQLGHRRSADFDFFRPRGFDPNELLRDLDTGPPLTVRRAETDTLTVEIDGVTTSFFGYPYPLLRPLLPTAWGVNLAAIEDIAAMKVSAIAGRGSRKDFVDLYVVCCEVMPLPEVLQRVDEKFRGVRYERYHVLKSLTYFDEADAELMPEMLRAASWEEIKRFFLRQAPALFSA